MIMVLINPSLDNLDPAKVAWFQHKIDQKWDEGLIVDMTELIADPTLREGNSPQTWDEQFISGDMPHPLSDDDTLLNSHLMGLRLNETLEDPKELNIAADVALAERLHANELF